MITRGRSVRTITALLLAGSLLAGTIGTAVAAVANVQYGGGDAVGDAGTGATPDTVSPGKVAGFYLWAHNADSANLATFFLTATTTASPVGAYWSHSASGPWTACDVSKGLQCTFGAFNSGTDLFVIAGFKLPGTTSTSTANCLTDPNRTTNPGEMAGVDPTGSSWVCVDFQWGSNSGYVPGKNKSRGDAYHWYDAVNTDTGSDAEAQFPFCDQSGTFTCDPSLLSINDSKTNFGKNNPQWTGVTAPTGTFNSQHGSSAIYVADNVSFDCSAIDATKCGKANLGQWSTVTVNDGQTSTDWYQVDIGVYGLAANKISAVYHFYQIGTTWYVEEITTVCPPPIGLNPPGPATTTSDPCFIVESGKGNSATVSVWTHHNGNFRLG